MQKSYELTLMLSPELEEKDEKKVIDLISKNIGDGKIKKKKKLGKQILAYPVKKQKEAIYWLLNLSFDGKEIQNLDKKLNMSQKVLRYLIVEKED